MLVDRDAFLEVFPEFKAEARFPSTQVALWLEDGEAILSEAAFGERRKLAVMLYAAHNLTVGSVAVSGASGPAGSATLAPVNAKSAGPLSKSYDLALIAYQGAGYWNATPYGQRFWAMIRGLVAGGFYRPSYRAGVPAAYGRLGAYR